MSSKLWRGFPMMEKKVSRSRGNFHYEKVRRLDLTKGRQLNLSVLPRSTYGKMFEINHSKMFLTFDEMIWSYPGFLRVSQTFSNELVRNWTVGYNSWFTGTEIGFERNLWSIISRNNLVSISNFFIQVKNDLLRKLMQDKHYDWDLKSMFEDIRSLGSRVPDLENVEFVRFGSVHVPNSLSQWTYPTPAAIVAWTDRTLLNGAHVFRQLLSSFRNYNTSQYVFTGKKDPIRVLARVLELINFSPFPGVHIGYQDLDDRLKVRDQMFNRGDDVRGIATGFTVDIKTMKLAWNNYAEWREAYRLAQKYRLPWLWPKSSWLQDMLDKEEGRGQMMAGEMTYNNVAYFFFQFVPRKVAMHILKLNYPAVNADFVDQLIEVCIRTELPKLERTVHFSVEMKRSTPLEMRNNHELEVYKKIKNFDYDLYDHLIRQVQLGTYMYEDSRINEIKNQRLSIMERRFMDNLFQDPSHRVLMKVNEVAWSQCLNPFGTQQYGQFDEEWFSVWNNSLFHESDDVALWGLGIELDENGRRIVINRPIVRASRFNEKDFIPGRVYRQRDLYNPMMSSYRDDVFMPRNTNSRVYHNFLNFERVRSKFLRRRSRVGDRGQATSYFINACMRLPVVAEAQAQPSSKKARLFRYSYDLERLHGTYRGNSKLDIIIEPNTEGFSMLDVIDEGEFLKDLFFMIPSLKMNDIEMLRMFLPSKAFGVGTTSLQGMPSWFSPNFLKRNVSTRRFSLDSVTHEDFTCQLVYETINQDFTPEIKLASWSERTFAEEYLVVSGLKVKKIDANHHEIFPLPYQPETYGHTLKLQLQNNPLRNLDVTVFAGLRKEQHSIFYNQNKFNTMFWGQNITSMLYDGSSFGHSLVVFETVAREVIEFSKWMISDPMHQNSYLYTRIDMLMQTVIRRLTYFNDLNWEGHLLQGRNTRSLSDFENRMGEFTKLINGMRNIKEEDKVTLVHHAEKMSANLKDHVEEQVGLRDVFGLEFDVLDQIVTNCPFLGFELTLNVPITTINKITGGLSGSMINSLISSLIMMSFDKKKIKYNRFGFMSISVNFGWIVVRTVRNLIDVRLTTWNEATFNFNDKDSNGRYLVTYGVNFLGGESSADNFIEAVQSSAKKNILMRAFMTTVELSKSVGDFFSITGSHQAAEGV